MSHRSPPGEVSPLPPPIMITSSPQLTTLLQTLSAHSIVAVDTESNSLYAYQEQVCLIQMSIPGADYILDPLAGLDLSPLADLFADPGVQKIFHAARYDVRCLKRDFDFRFANLFDTMWAARILGWPRVGLGDILKDNFGVHTNKRYQRYNWGKRPLEPEALAYASLDTHYLLSIRDMQAEALAREGRMEEAREVFDQLIDAEPMSHVFDPADFRRIRGSSKLKKRQQAILRELYIWRDREARRRDRPLFKILHNRTLIKLAQIRPHTLDQLARVPKLKRHHVRRYGKHILQAIKRGERARPPKPPPPPPRHSRAEMERYRALRTWRKQVAAERGVDVDVIVSNAILWSIAEQNPRDRESLRDIEGLGAWKRRTYGKEILAILRDGR